MRLPEGPWYRASRDAWYVEVDGKQVRLAKGKANTRPTPSLRSKVLLSADGGRGGPQPGGLRP
jgi:hypothetical protein